jgi:SsrA-binding protein
MARKKDKKNVGRSASAEDGRRVLATNRRARRNYVVEARIEAGLVLTGSEVKSLRSTSPTIAEGYARIKGGELYLEGVHIQPLPQASYLNHDPVRSRKCLVHKKELAKIIRLLEAQGATMIPLQMYFKGPRIKVELGIARGRRKADKREYEKAKADRREMRNLRR